MVQRKRKKKNKMRGNRTHGKGNTKNKRGAGCRGGRGRAGSHKHKYSKYYAEFGQKKRLKPKEGKRAVNLKDLNRLVSGLLEKGLIKKEGEKIVVEGSSFPFGKIIGRGSLKETIEVRGVKVSKKAMKKIAEKGGTVHGEESK